VRDGFGLRWFIGAATLLLPAAGFAAGACEVGPRVVRDAELARSWRLIVDCRHPEWPARMVATTDAAGREIAGGVKPRDSSPAVKAPVMVRAGETVRVWRQDAMVRLETSGVAESGGEFGKPIRVRLIRRDSSGQVVEQHVNGLVDGLGSVEMSR
jgi:hypothetical protein